MRVLMVAGSRRARPRHRRGVARSRDRNDLAHDGAAAQQTDAVYRYNVIMLD
jgi:hypothetical protein